MSNFLPQTKSSGMNEAVKELGNEQTVKRSMRTVPMLPIDKHNRMAYIIPIQ